MRSLAAAALLALAITCSARADEPPLGDCDRLAAHPEDPQRVHAGMPITALDEERAVAACETALAAAPESARFRFQYGRALDKMDSFQDALGQYRVAAKERYPAAQYAMGLIFERSNVMPFNKMKAARWYRGAADKSHAGAQFRLGLLHRTGEGVAQDDGEALTLLRAAANQGLARAQYVVGQMYDLGLGVAQDPAQAADWYRKAAGQNHRRARFALEAMAAEVREMPLAEATAPQAALEAGSDEAAEEASDTGIGATVGAPVIAPVIAPVVAPVVAAVVAVAAPAPVPEPDQAAPAVPPAIGDDAQTELEPQAAALNVEARTPLDVAAVANQLGAGLSAYQAGNYESAYVTWFPLARYGIRRAEFYIGGLLMEGRGVESDNVRAYYWLKRAATKGYPAAQPLFVELISRMSADEMKRAEELIASGGPKS